MRAGKEFRGNTEDIKGFYIIRIPNYLRNTNLGINCTAKQSAHYPMKLDPKPTTH